MGKLHPKRTFIEDQVATIAAIGSIIVAGIDWKVFHEGGGPWGRDVGIPNTSACFIIELSALNVRHEIIIDPEHPETYIISSSDRLIENDRSRYRMLSYEDLVEIGRGQESLLHLTSTDATLIDAAIRKHLETKEES